MQALPCNFCLCCCRIISLLAGLSLQGRKVAVFGCGDQHGYGDYFCDAMEELHSSFAAAGADMVGQWPTQGYEHSESKVGDARVSGLDPWP
jgi:flavodoxin